MPCLMGCPAPRCNSDILLVAYMPYMARTKITPDPAPALSRGLGLLRLLEREGACSLEHLARLTGWPKSSVARLLRTLEQCGVIGRDDATKRYHCRCHLVAVANANPGLRQRMLREMAELCRQVQQTVELYRFDGDALTMIDRCEPEDVPVRVVARVGNRRDLSEGDSLTQIALAFGLSAAKWPKRPLWAWSEGKKVKLSSQRLRALAVAAKKDRFAGDLDINTNGVRRYAAPLLGARGDLLGVLAIAQSYRPAQTGPDRLLLKAVQEAGERLSSIIASSSIGHLE